MNFRELLSNGIYVPLIGLSIIKLLGTAFIISHTFQCERFFSFDCPGKFEKVSQGGFCGTLFHILSASNGRLSKVTAEIEALVISASISLDNRRETCFRPIDGVYSYMYLLIKKEIHVFPRTRKVLLLQHFANCRRLVYIYFNLRAKNSSL